MVQTLMSNEPDATLAHRAGTLLGRGRHAAALAAALACPVETARSWTRGRRRLPAWRARDLAGRLRAYASAALSMAVEVERYAREQERGPKARQRFPCRL